VGDDLRLQPGGVGVDERDRPVRRPAQRVAERGGAGAGEGEVEILPQHVARAAHEGGAPLGEDPRRVDDVGAGRGEQGRHLGELGDDEPHPHGRRIALDGHEVVDAVVERRGVEHRIAAPALEGLLLEEPPVDDAEEDAAVDALVSGQLGGIEPLELCLVALQRGDLAVDGARREVVEEGVVLVEAVAGGDGGMVPGKVVEVAVDESREGGRGRGGGVLGRQCDGGDSDQNKNAEYLADQGHAGGRSVETSRIRRRCRRRATKTLYPTVCSCPRLHWSAAAPTRWPNPGAAPWRTSEPVLVLRKFR
jgi:hypothetical protein